MIIHELKKKSWEKIFDLIERFFECGNTKQSLIPPVAIYSPPKSVPLFDSKILKKSLKIFNGSFNKFFDENYRALFFHQICSTLLVHKNLDL